MRRIFVDIENYENKDLYKPNDVVEIRKRLVGKLIEKDIERKSIDMYM